jgi:hypothetical protein
MLSIYIYIYIYKPIKRLNIKYKMIIYKNITKNMMNNKNNNKQKGHLCGNCFNKTMVMAWLWHIYVPIMVVFYHI